MISRLTTALIMIAGLGLTAGAGTATASAAHQAQAAREEAWVTADGVRLRTSPSGTATVIGLLYTNDHGYILSWTGTWCRFRLLDPSASGLPTGTTGYASCAYFQILGMKIADDSAPVDPLETAS
ncbi:hypothetical protein [Nonomuraea sp. NPDC046570]|uniref:hypothetical protein n=1 Tax=Nonomuraea sp. NPDC046570 TaxID=3155255 RepID=UPI0033D7011E